MFVVRIEDLETVSFRAFGRGGEAASFATISAERNDVVAAEVYEISGVADPEKAVSAARYGYGTLLPTLAKWDGEEGVMHADFRGGIALGTGAGF